MMPDLHRWTVAWFILCVAMALHIFEEATTGAYRTTGATIDFLRQLFPWLPPFQFTVWVLDISGAVLVLLGLTWLVHKRHKLMLPASYAFATFTTANATLHLLLSLAWGHLLPGAATSPLLLAASLFLLLSIPRGDALDELASARIPNSQA